MNNEIYTQYLKGVFQNLDSFSRNIATINMYRNIAFAAITFSENGIILGDLVFEKSDASSKIAEEYYDNYMNGSKKTIEKGHKISQKLKTLDIKETDFLQELVLSEMATYYDAFMEHITNNVYSYTVSEVQILEGLAEDIKNYPAEAKNKKSYEYILNFTNAVKNESPSQEVIDLVYKAHRFFDEKSLVFIMLQKPNFDVLLESIIYNYENEKAALKAQQEDFQDSINIIEDEENHYIPLKRKIKFEKAKRILTNKDENEKADSIAENLIHTAKLFAKELLFFSKNTKRISHNFKSEFKYESIFLSSKYNTNYANLVHDWKAASPEVKEKVKEIQKQKRKLIDEHMDGAMEGALVIKDLLKKYFDFNITLTALARALPKAHEAMDMSNKLLDIIENQVNRTKPSQAKILNFPNKLKMKSKRHNFKER